MSSTSLTLVLLWETFAVCRLEADAAIPVWATQGAFFSLTRTADELSLVVTQAQVPAGLPPGMLCERDWRAVKVEGPLDFALTGILNSLCAPLAESGVCVFALSTYDTDYILIKEAQWQVAYEVLRQRHTIETEPKM